MINYLALQWKTFKAKFFGEENGAVDLIVIIILIVIVIALALVFKDKIGILIDKLFGAAEEGVNQIISPTP